MIFRHGYVKENLYKALFVLSLCTVFFACGVFITEFRMFPYYYVRDGIITLKELQYWRTYVGLKPTSHLMRPRIGIGGEPADEDPRAFEGITFMSGFFDDALGFQVVDMNGNPLHKWRVSYGQIWPNPEHISDPDKVIPLNDWLTTIHGAALLPNGDIVFSFLYLGLVRIDRCGEVVWRLPHQTHHSVFIDNKGHIWTVAIMYTREGIEGFPNITPPVWNELVLEISPDGEILRTIDLLQVIRKNRYEGVLFANGLNNVSLRIKDPLHVNDVEVLSPEIADAFPMFDAGDILVSARNVNLIMVIDPDTEEIKWSQTGPWLRQHDPDFLPTGEISVFDNRKDDSAGAIFGGSRILLVQPATGNVKTIYEGTKDQPFFTNRAGKHQYLENGNILITERGNGRVFEITPAGDLVWSFVNRYDEDEVASVTQADRFPTAYGEFLGTECK